jgi:hypothetical protein
VRTTPLTGKKAWFGPRRFGWGLGPRSPEGWAVVAVGIVAIIVVGVVVRHAAWAVVIVAAALIAVTFLKGTSPGGPARWAEMNAQQDDSSER